MNDLKIHLGRPAAWIEVEGDDSFPFLQGQFSNDLRSTSPAPVTYGLWLDRKGRALADSFVLQTGPRQFFLYSYHSPAETLIHRLEPYIIADDVTLRDLTAHAVSASVWGVAADVGAALAAAGWSFPDERSLVQKDHRFVLRGRRSRLPNVDLVVTGDDNEESAAALCAAVLDAGGAVVDEAEAARERVASGIPAVPLDIGPAELPQEGGLEEPAISYDKGCYLGQEVMARIRSMGQVRRALVPVSINEINTPAGHTLYAGEREAGLLRSTAPGDPFLGLALVKIDVLKQTDAFSLAPGADPVVFVVNSSDQPAWRWTRMN